MNYTQMLETVLRLKVAEELFLKALDENGVSYSRIEPDGIMIDAPDEKREAVVALFKEYLLKAVPCPHIRKEIRPGTEWWTCPDCDARFK